MTEVDADQNYLVTRDGILEDEQLPGACEAEDEDESEDEDDYAWDPSGWRWRDGTRLGYTNWNRGWSNEPDNWNGNGEGNVIMNLEYAYEGTWFDASDHAGAYALCYSRSHDFAGSLALRDEDNDSELFHAATSGWLRKDDKARRRRVTTVPRRASSDSSSDLEQNT